MLRALAIAPLPVTLLIGSFLAPTELSLFLGGLRLPLHRVVLILVFLPALYRLVTRTDTRIRGFDVLFFAFAVWTVVTFTQHEGWPAGFIYGGSLALEGFGAYVVARAYVRDLPALGASLRVMLAAIALAALIALPETLLGQTFTHDVLRSLTGYHHPTAVETRMGLTRAYGPFDHPIHYGTFCAGLLALLWFTAPRRRRLGRAGLVGGATLLGMSSAPLLCLGFQAGLMTWEKLTRTLPSRLTITAAILVGLYIGISLVSTRGPIAIIATGMTLDSWTGYYRLQIWEHGLANVWAHPWMGIGLKDWERPWWMVASTVDAFWLVVAMRQGIPALLILASAILLMAHAVYRNQRRHGDPKAGRLAVKGWLMSLIALCLIGATVHYWNVLYAYFFFFLGLGGCLADVKAPRRMAARSAAVEPAQGTTQASRSLRPVLARSRALDQGAARPLDPARGITPFDCVWGTRVPQTPGDGSRV